MYPYIVIVRRDRRSDGISIIPDESNTLTRQSAGRNASPRDPLLRPVTKSF